MNRFKDRLQALVCAALLATANSVAANEGWSDSEAVMAEPLAALDAQLKAMASTPTAASLTVVIVRAGKPVLMRSYGLADKTAKTPASLDTTYHMASVSKPFVATAVMQLASQGRLDLDAPVARYIPAFRPTGPGAETITTRQLLQHTAGLPDVEDYQWAQGTSDPGAAERYVRSLEGTRLRHEPGRRSEYSNMGYDVLGYLIAEVSGMPFETYMREHLLAPAGMRTASFLRSEMDPKNEAKGHILEDGRASPVYPYNRAHAPSSTLHASAKDMAAWLSAITAAPRSFGALLPEKALAEMWSGNTVDQGRQRAVLGWFASPFRGHARYSHTGGDIGFAAYMAVFPDDQLGIALMTNSPMALPTQDILLATVKGAFAALVEVPAK